MPKASRQNRSAQSKSLNGPAIHSGLENGQHPRISHGSVTSSGLTSVTAPTKSTTGRGGGGMQSVKQTFQVNPNTGTLNFAIPIKTSKSRAAVEPSLALSYSSGHGNGAFGVGWRISHGVITRKTSKGIPKYDQDDVFLLDGDDDLVPVHYRDDTVDSHETAVSSLYIIDRFLPRFISDRKRIERWTKKSDMNDIHWVVISADNVTTVYGSSDESRVFENIHDGGRRIFTWLPAKSFDSFGNSMEYVYKSEDMAGLDNPPSHIRQYELHRVPATVCRARYLKSIKYGNRTPNRDLELWSKVVLTNPNDWMFEVIFDYGEHDLDVPTTQEIFPWVVRQDPFSTYTSGFEVRLYRLCRRILMFHHMPEVLNKDDYLISSTVFNYDESPAMTSLTSITMSGYQANENGGYMEEKFAPWEFHYSKNPDLQSLTVGEIDNFNLAALPGGVAPFTAEWVDLDGDGAPGLLVENSARSLYYQRNMSDRDMGARFGPLCSLPNQPALFSKGRYFEDIDRNGRLDLVCTNEYGAGVGYYERIADGWANFKDFDQILNNREPPENLARIDVMGNGLQDVVIFHKDRSEVRWHPSLAKEGFGKAISANMSDSIFTASSSSRSIMTAFADMSGDGLVDVVRVSSGQISYWPNLGYGKFGTEVVMGNSPVFGEMGSLDQSRILFTDVDGTGTADLLYFPEEGGVWLHYNLAGNAWGEPLLISQFPRLHTLSTVSLVDLFGNGTSCLCWTGPDLTGSSRHTLQYLDLTNGYKPHMLSEFSNGMGHAWKITYQSSTFFYRLDEAEGKPWKTRLSSPLQCVESTRAEDKITGICMTTRFRYHDGMYDGVEREFAGFAAVEQWDAEKFDNNAASFTRPPVHKKTWYHSGCLGHDGRFTTPKGIPILGSLKVPAGVTDIEGFRALRGRALREEVFSDDNSTLQDLPYTVTQFNYSVNVVQSKDENTHPVLRISEMDTLTCNYERQVDHPRCTYSSVIETNKFGQPLKSITVAYGHRNSSLPNSRDKIAQQEDIVTYNENTYTNAIDIAGIYRLPAPASVKKWRLLGYKANAESSEQLIRSITLALAQCKQVDAVEADSNKPQSCKVLLEEHRTYYRREDLSDYLKLEKLEPFSPTSQTYSLVASQPPEWKDSFSKNSYTLPDWFKTSFGYVDLDKDKLQWRPSSRQIYSQSSNSELKDARKSFFSPLCIIDPLENQQSFEYDDKWLFQTKATDAIGNVTSTAFSYAALQPIRIQDANGNQIQYTYDASGDMFGEAQMGKRSEDIGDSVHDAPLSVTHALLDKFISNPIQEAAGILGNLTSRTIKDRTRFHRYLPQGKHQPCFEATIGRSKHAHEGSPGVLSIKITYWDSQANPIQHVELTNIDKAGAPTWCVSGGTLKDNKGEVVREYHPMLSDTHFFRPHEALAKRATTYLLDPLGRRIATLNANHSWRKTVLSAWEKVEYDEADTVLTSDASQDENVGSYFKSIDRELYFPSWYDSKRLAGSDATVFEESGASAIFHNTPSMEHFDSLGRSISSMSDVNGLNATTSTSYSCLGYEACLYDSLGRTVETVAQDLLQSYRVVQAMDSMATHTVLNSINQPVLSWTDGGPLRMFVYDGVGRVTQVWISHSGTKLFLSQKNIYGETLSNAEADNLRGQLFQTFDQSGLTTHAEYDFKGNCLAKKKQLAINYKDELDWSSSVELESEIFLSTFQYDAQNHVVVARSPNSDITKTQHNNWGLPTNVVWQSLATGDAECIVDEAYYNAEQQTTLVKVGNGGQSKYVYDETTGNLVEKVITRPDGAKIEHKMYIHDCLGRETYVKDDSQQTIFFRNSQIMPICRYRYDGLGRLISATGREQVNVGSGTGRSFSQSRAPNIGSSENPGSGKEMAEYLEEYQYDLAGNILQMSHKCPKDSSIRGWVRKYSYTEQSLLKPTELSNRLSQTEISDHIETYEYATPDKYGYDRPGGANGCITSMPGFSSLSWDFENRLKSSSTQIQKTGTPETTYYVYDSSGFRVRKVTERSSAVNSDKTRLSETVYLENYNIYRRFSGDGVTVSLEKKSTHVCTNKVVGILESCPIGKTTLANLMRLKLDDGLEVDKESRIIVHEEYSPFGATTYSASHSDITAPAVYRYASYERDQETGLCHVGHRYYAPWLGRWISLDPIGTADDLNRYAYVGNNPIMFVDPEGTMKIERTTAEIDNLKKQEAQKSWGNNFKYEVGKVVLASAFIYSAQRFLPGKRTLIAGAMEGAYNAKAKEYARASAQYAQFLAGKAKFPSWYRNPLFFGKWTKEDLKNAARGDKFAPIKPDIQKYDIFAQWGVKGLDTSWKLFVPKPFVNEISEVIDAVKSLREIVSDGKLTQPMGKLLDQYEGHKKDDKWDKAEDHKRTEETVSTVEKITGNSEKIVTNSPGAWEILKVMYYGSNSG